MDQEKVKQYANMVPLEIKIPARALTTDPRWALFLFLVTNGEKRFNEIQREFDANPNDITPVLKALVGGGLVKKYAKDHESFIDNRATFYRPTKLGLKYLHALCDVVLPIHPLGNSQYEQKSMIEIQSYKKIGYQTSSYQNFGGKVKSDAR